MNDFKEGVLIMVETLVIANAFFVPMEILLKLFFFGPGPSENYPGIWVFLLIVFNAFLYFFI